MGNWGSILSVLGMVGMGLGEGLKGEEKERPQTLVRIPVDLGGDGVNEVGNAGVEIRGGEDGEGA